MKIVLALVAVVGLFIGGSYAYTSATEEILETTVTKTERECKTSDNGSDCRYVVYTPEEVFENVDSWWYLKFNSSDYNNKLSSGIGQKYRLTVYGIRIPFLSMYRNVVDYERIN